MSVLNGTAIEGVIRRALDIGISVICFDSDAVDSDRQAYVGTDNVAFGEQLAKVLLQLEPQGGKFVISSFPVPNLVEREYGILRTLNGTAWSLHSEGVVLDDRSMEKFQDMQSRHPDITAVIPTYGGPMRDTDRWISMVADSGNTTFVVADAMSHQIALMEQGYAGGLVGQLPYQSGKQCVDTLLELQRQGNPPRNVENDQIYGTNLSFMLRIPLVLPDLVVDQNYIGGLRILGYTVYALLVIFDVYLMWWVFFYRKTHVVRAAQPFFLVTIGIGVFIMASSIIPLSMDDQYYSQSAMDFACNATPWFVSTGFTLVFSALFSKLYRIYRLIDSAERFRKERVTIQDVIVPFFVITALNKVILVCWIVIDPLMYTRNDNDGTDPWNRVISTYGTCSSSSGFSSAPFVGALAGVNFLALVAANFWAFRTRHVQSELSESRFIAATVLCMTQAMLVGLPVLLLVVDDPRVSYIVRIMLVTSVCGAVLAFIFIPKVLARSSLERRPNIVVSMGLSGLPRKSSQSLGFIYQRKNSVVHDEEAPHGAHDPVSDSTLTVAAIRAAVAAPASSEASSTDTEAQEGPDTTVLEISSFPEPDLIDRIKDEETTWGGGLSSELSL